MPFLKCLVARDEQFGPELTAEGLAEVGGLRHFMVLRNGEPLAHDPKDRENREGGGPPSSPERKRWRAGITRP